VKLAFILTTLMIDGKRGFMQARLLVSLLEGMRGVLFIGAVSVGWLVVAEVP